MSAELTVKHVHSDSIGYGRLGTELYTALRKAGVTVYDGIEGDPVEQIENVNAGRTKIVLWVSTPAHAQRWLTGQSVSIFTMWEATVLPESMRENLDKMDTVLVPSLQNQEVFSVYHDDVRFVPLGIDTERWHWQPRRESHYFNVLVAGSGARKNPDGALRVFNDAFPDRSKGDRIPRLVHKSPRGQEIVGQEVLTVSGYISQEAELDLYSEAHVYLCPSKGEGFGLQPLQAMAQGIPTILADAHGQAAFAHFAYPVGTTMTKAGQFMMGDAGEWWEPNYDEMVDHLRWIYENYEKAEAKAYEASSSVAMQFSTRRLALNTIEALGGRKALKPYDGNGEWYYPDPRLFRVVTKTHWKAEIAGNVVQCEPGEEYWLNADVKRVAYDRGVLDACCIETEINAGKPVKDWVDTALTDEQLKHFAESRLTPKACWSCGQILGSGVTASDLIFERLEREAANA